MPRKKVARPPGGFPCVHPGCKHKLRLDRLRGYCSTCDKRIRRNGKPELVKIPWTKREDELLYDVIAGIDGGVGKVPRDGSLEDIANRLERTPMACTRRLSNLRKQRQAEIDAGLDLIG